ncbi:MAG: WYL domain-containing protein [Blastocatellia bacterium]|nr:WYL domain-containing protein [Blastocatellia bacterium]
MRDLERVFWIDHQIRAERFPNATTIAKHFEITTRTAQTTLEFMRDRLRMPLEYSADKRGWYYSEPTYSLPAVELTEGDLIAILLVEKFSRQYRGTAIAEQVQTSFSKVLDAMTDVVSLDLSALSDAYSFEAAATTDLDPNVFTTVGRAIRERRTIEMVYFAATRGKVERRRINPLHLRNHLGEWYLIAWDHLREAFRVFLVSRIQELSVLEDGFEVPPGFTPQEYLHSSFGMMLGAEPQCVVVIFDEYQARWIRERGKFHATEEREELPGGRLQLTMTVTNLYGVKRFIMQYGAHAEVVEPEELRDSVGREAQEILQRYSSRKENA